MTVSFYVYNIICYRFYNVCISKLATEPGGKGDVDLPLNDYFMALAVLAKSRSSCNERVSDDDSAFIYECSAVWQSK